MIERLTKRSDFISARNLGKIFVMSCLVLQYRCGDRLRFGITASRKVGGAVERNRIKRRLRVLFRELVATQTVPVGDYVLVARHCALKAPFSKLRQDFVRTLPRLQENHP